jgi:hypothetical protein
MAERMTSREEADVLKNAINGLANDFERMGFSRGQIGSAMAGIGLGMVQVHQGHDIAIRTVNAVLDCLMSDVATTLARLHSFASASGCSGA